jgi:dienelactone hydrolase
VGTEQPSFQYFEPFDFSEPFNNRMPSVFRCVPHGGPAVFVLHELCGASPPTFDFAYRIANEGFSVFVPVLFGEANAAFRLDSAVRDAIHVCVSREFSILAANRSSPIVQWVRKLGSHVFAEIGGKGIGVIGLCLTGNFALAMMVDSHVKAPVVSEPALPFGVTPCLRAALGLSPAEVAAIRQRTAAGQEVLAFRFDGDGLSPEERDEMLRATFSNIRGNGRLRPTRPRAHAVFTDHFDPAPGSSTEIALQQASLCHTATTSRIVANPSKSAALRV